ncbi:hypothetical protein ACIBPB_26620 [Micromonospora sp. NPDC049836]|uniref:hypothetical protein n=1 Tax=Micromonospora sp. NPDC049836 TaxID=3364274 RepID=UPI003787306A
MALPGAIAVVSSLAFRLVREKIRADRDRALVEMALRDSEPGDRRDILEGLAELRLLNAQALRGEEPGSDLAPATPGRQRTTPGARGTQQITHSLSCIVTTSLIPVQDGYHSTQEDRISALPNQKPYSGQTQNRRDGDRVSWYP